MRDVTRLFAANARNNIVALLTKRPLPYVLGHACLNSFRENRSNYFDIFLLRPLGVQSKERVSFVVTYGLLVLFVNTFG